MAGNTVRSSEFFTVWNEAPGLTSRLHLQLDDSECQELPTPIAVEGKALILNPIVLEGP